MIKGIYQIFVYNPETQKVYWRTSGGLSEMFEEFIREFGHYMNGQTLVEGIFRFTKDTVGGYWIDFRPTHPSR
jgi:hypothetical protein